MTVIKLVARLFALMLLFTCAGLAQQQPCVDLTLEPAEPSSHMKRDLAETADRVMGVRPSQTVDSEKPVCPLTNAEKLHVFLKDSYSPFNIVAAAFNAAILQASQGRKGYGQGWDAYASRFGAAMADSESSGLFQSFLLPALFHQDPRYFRMREGPVMRRGMYAVTRIFVTHGDNGRHQFNFSEVLGGFASSGVSNAYYPRDQRDAGDVLYRAGLGIASDAGWNLLKEFGPDIRRKFRHKDKEASKTNPAGYTNVPRP